MLNMVRESKDHGPYNSWDRVPYITTIRTGKPSIVPGEWCTPGGLSYVDGLEQSCGRVCCMVSSARA